MSGGIAAQFFGGPLDGEDSTVPDPPPPLLPVRRGGRTYVYRRTQVMMMLDGAKLVVYRYEG